MNNKNLRASRRHEGRSQVNRAVRIAIFGLILVQAGACASRPDVTNDDPEARSSVDPWESANRGVYAFNDGLDTISLKPVSRGYKKVAPGFVRRGISNFFGNLRTPLIIVNDLLQGKGRDALGDTGRLVLNSTVGIGGLFDVATPAGLEQHDEDFGQTLAKWGVPDGPYVMLPLLGPRTLRDAMATPLNFLLDPLVYYDNASVRDKLWTLDAIHIRSRLLAVEGTIKSSQDPYVTIREAYLQNRAFLIHDGNPPNGDDDLFDELVIEE